MARDKKMRWFFRLLAILLGALFIYTGAIKAWDPLGFASDIENYHIVPWSLGVRAAFYLPWLELLCGIALIFRRLELGAVAILTTLMVGFLGAIISARARGIDVTCGCFGHAAKNLSFAGHLALDCAILTALILLMFRFWGTDGSTKLDTKAPTYRGPLRRA